MKQKSKEKNGYLALYNGIKHLIQIGIALSGEKNIDRLLEIIVDEAREFANADAGTLYIISDNEKELHFAIVQNKSLNLRMGGTGGKMTWPPVQLVKADGMPNYANVSSYVAISGESVNIEDEFWCSFSYTLNF